MATDFDNRDMPKSDPEKGHDEESGARKISHVRGITTMIVPSCAVFLVVFSIGSIFALTFNNHQPLPFQATVAICSLLFILLSFFLAGVYYLRFKKRHPPKSNSPDITDQGPHDKKTSGIHANVNHVQVRKHVIKNMVNGH